MRHFRRIFALFFVLVTLASALYGCGKSKQAENTESSREQNEAINSLEKYFLYVDGGKLFRLNATTGQTVQIDLGFSVETAYNALIGDNHQRMVVCVKKEGMENTSLIYWDGTSRKAKYLGDDLTLARVSKDGQYIWYTRGETKELYCYNANTASEKRIADNLYAIAVSDDGKTAFLEQNYVNGEGTQVTRLSYAFSDGTVMEITDNAVPRTANVSQDRSAVCYTKKDEIEDHLLLTVPPKSQAYIWTKTGGEKKLPFKANKVTMFAPDEIYYLQTDTDGILSHFYYDGKTSSCLLTKSTHCAHKASDYLYFYEPTLRTTDAFSYVAYKGKGIPTNIFFCIPKGIATFASKDGKRLYNINTWNEENIPTMYRVSLGDDKKLTQEVLFYPKRDYSPRFGSFWNEQYCFLTEDKELYLNDQKVAEGIDTHDYVQSRNGKFLVYQKEGDLYAYADGETAKYEIAEEIKEFMPAQKNRVVYLGGNNKLTLLSTGTTNAQTFGENVTNVSSVDSWSHSEMFDMLTNWERTGAWFNNELLSLVWRQ